MNTSVNRKSFLQSIVWSPVAAVLILTLLFWATGLPALLRSAEAAQLTFISATLSDSAPSNLASTTIAWTTATSTTAGQTIKIQFDPVTSLFAEVYSSATSTDIVGSGLTVVNNLGACPGSGTNVYPTGNYNNGTDENLTLTVCPSNTVLPGAKSIDIGAGGTKLLYNPNVVGSYRITIGGTWLDSGETRVAIINNVVVTASIDTTFTFTIAGLASGSTVNGTTTSTTTSATALQFGTLVPYTPKFLAQKLTVTTNARNGFVVTVQQNQNLLSSTGAYIPLFSNGATTTTPIVFVAPTAVLDNHATYSHIGVTSDDADLNGGEFTGTKFAGNFNTARQVFSHTGPADGTTANKGTAQVGFEIETSALQEAANDYTNTLTYVATPTF